jgi:hypothetical protein
MTTLSVVSSEIILLVDHPRLEAEAVVVDKLGRAGHPRLHRIVLSHRVRDPQFQRTPSPALSQIPPQFVLQHSCRGPKGLGGSSRPSWDKPQCFPPQMRNARWDQYSPQDRLDCR